ncbi:branched-chain amino acid transporter permease [Corynebacterium diphtheriae]|uniref:branched-chain amino acid transporter permease n=1 Tax=Corynebacterium diphtheriae TaxID=1717 RepID=UPI000B4B17C0|nr:AzlD domain-containing protein [Corynebacterium diphtheriae]OWN07023.1 branched-chain amino acid ABC transporter permease [Corynebacterium belfantii]OWM54164.1 branched-chain amino acid ABC transporter permease [Corynebacterium diphtheriae]OWM96522.1 branched-chain amino acid ABC transporter permease [Corynebacterium diphtheriae bv. mitis]OWN13005.1 branched-chain amino acid ABC transporter permease [Corynebacterium diphtheriae bv. mitis]OWN14892.1 branched-chain amino acid ABC transporter 
MNPLVLAGSAGLPDGISLLSVFAVIIPVAIVTVLLRQIPFAAVRLLNGSPLMGLLAMTMPVGVMVVLVMYTLYGSLEAPGGLVAALIASIGTLVLHWLRRNPGLSIMGGTALYMVLVNLVW